MSHLCSNSGYPVASVKKWATLCLQAEKRRESIMVGLNKTRDQLSVSEERIKQLQLENQRTQMDLLAKTGRQFEAQHIYACCKLLQVR